jgi:hypothetical protein
MNPYESQANSEKVPELPPEVTLLFPNQHQRDLAALTYQLYTNNEFREKFWKDPSGAIVEAGLTADAEIVDALHKADRVIIDRLVEDGKEVLRRGGAFKWGEGPGPEPRTILALMAVAFIAGVAAGALLAQVEKMRKI